MSGSVLLLRNAILVGPIFVEYKTQKPSHNSDNILKINCNGNNLAPVLPPPWQTIKTSAKNRPEQLLSKI